jgi:hypothetical protein
VGFVVDKVALGQVFSDYFSFLCQFSFHRLLQTHHHLLSGAGIIGQLVADVPSLTSPQETKKKKDSDGNCSHICVAVGYPSRNSAEDRVVLIFFGLCLSLFNDAVSGP